MNYPQEQNNTMQNSIKDVLSYSYIQTEFFILKSVRNIMIFLCVKYIHTEQVNWAIELQVSDPGPHPPPNLALGPPRHNKAELHHRTCNNTSLPSVDSMCGMIVNGAFDTEDTLWGGCFTWVLLNLKCVEMTHCSAQTAPLSTRVTWYL